MLIAKNEDINDSRRKMTVIIVKTSTFWVTCHRTTENLAVSRFGGRILTFSCLPVAVTVSLASLAFKAFAAFYLRSIRVLI